MRDRRLLPGVVCLCLSFATGCSLSPLARNTAAFSSATNLLVENTGNVYRTAVRLNEQAQASLLVARYDTDHPMDPHTIRPLIDNKGLNARTKVLEGLLVYAQTVADMAGGVSAPGLDEAAAACGANLKSLSDALADSASTGISIGASEANAASTAMKALGDLLVNREIHHSVPKIIRDMDPNVAELSKLLSNDVEILRDQAGRDYEQILAQEDQFIRHSGSSLSATERRAEIERLPRILSDRRITDDMLVELQVTLRKVALTHHALAVAAARKDNASLQARIADLRASAEQLASFYESLSSSK
jgi:hypothetical protein